MENTTLISVSIITSVLKLQIFKTSLSSLVSPLNETNHWGTLWLCWMFVSASQEFLTTSAEDHPQCFPIIQNAWPFIYSQWSISRLCLFMISQTAVWSSLVFLRKDRCAHFHKFNQTDWTDSFHPFDCFFFRSIFLLVSQLWWTES